MGLVVATVIEDRLLPPGPIELIKPSESPESPEPIKPTEQSDAPAAPDNTDR
ncbi:hypothetical protein ABT352_16015 [Streptosporangium sp. NPDC000563]|uniref:hypothetical protein n=1 Tax=unclassified Streptosporangium TaxID=2632669 RepID=UPI00332317B9